MTKKLCGRIPPPLIFELGGTNPMRQVAATVLGSVCLLLPVNASAGPITVGPFLGVEVGYFETAAQPNPFVATLGASVMSNGSDISPAIDGRTFEAYCVDIIGPIFNAGMTPPGGTFEATAALMSGWSLSTTGGAFAGNYAAWLYNSFAEGIAAMTDTAAANINRTSLQMALWNVLYDGDATVTGGAFRVDNFDQAVQLQADQYLSQLFENLPEAQLSDATWLRLEDCGSGTCRDAQDFIGPLAMNSQPVPEPGTLLLLSSGLVVGGWRWRRGSAPANKN